MNKNEKKESKKKKKVESDLYGDEFEEDQGNKEININEDTNQEIDLDDDTKEELYS